MCIDGSLDVTLSVACSPAAGKSAVITNTSRPWKGTALMWISLDACGGPLAVDEKLCVKLRGVAASAEVENVTVAVYEAPGVSGATGITIPAPAGTWSVCRSSTMSTGTEPLGPVSVAAVRSLSPEKPSGLGPSQ